MSSKDKFKDLKKEESVKTIATLPEKEQVSDAEIKAILSEEEYEFFLERSGIMGAQREHDLLAFAEILGARQEQNELIKKIIKDLKGVEIKNEDTIKRISKRNNKQSNNNRS